MRVIWVAADTVCVPTRRPSSEKVDDHRLVAITLPNGVDRTRNAGGGGAANAAVMMGDGPPKSVGPCLTDGMNGHGG